MYHSLFIQSLTEVHLDYFQVPEVVNKVAIKSMCKYLNGHTYSVCLGKTKDPKSAVSGPYCKKMFSFLRNHQTVFQLFLHTVLYSHWQ